MQNLQTWEILDKEIKACIFRNGLTTEMIKERVNGELNELVIKTVYGFETLFYGNSEAFIVVDVNGVDYTFEYVIDNYNGTDYLVNF